MSWILQTGTDGYLQVYYDFSLKPQSKEYHQRPSS